MLAFPLLICSCVENYCSDSSDKRHMETVVLVILLLLYYNFFDWWLFCRVDLAFDTFL